jgi:hypothetical protein
MGFTGFRLISAENVVDRRPALRGAWRVFDGTLIVDVLRRSEILVGREEREGEQCK